MKSFPTIQPYTEKENKEFPSPTFMKQAIICEWLISVDLLTTNIY